MHRQEQQTYDELRYQLAYNVHLIVHSQKIMIQTHTMHAPILTTRQL